MHAAPRAASAWLSKPGNGIPCVNRDRSLDFARDRRIVKTDEFSSVFRLRPVQRSAHFVLYTRINSLPHARLGVVVAKRLAPRAVTRNAIKRAVRELFRQSPLPALDCIVRLAKPVNTKKAPASSAALKAALHQELRQLFQTFQLQALPEASS
ncbi:ribonuclease P protein component [Noviherbaspirillum sedimenti]|uniref:Ribonuclease P protein component n=1 Tax=Noviherbaspirillum sedimenti TaxID=2320865 RepID=A0A3A3G559_9BURK|nr:ribonuclease P protein component [Noviherbaspirillum sedimenti]